MLEKITYYLESTLLAAIMLVFSALPVDMASRLGGWVARTIGPPLKLSNRAWRNLYIPYPAANDREKRKVVTAMWDNLGRIVAEYPHLETIAAERVTVVNEHIVKDVIAAGNGGVFFSGHIGNWETLGPAMLERHGVAAALTYRNLNNPFADRMLKKYRTLSGRIKAFPKARESGRQMIAELKDKHYLAILIDQKYNEGVAVPFMGRPAMTNPVFVQMAQKYKCPLVPVRCKRLDGAHFEITLYDPLKLFDDSGNALPVEEIITTAHRLLESWIKDTPGQWLWLHRRWDSAQLKDKSVQGL